MDPRNDIDELASDRVDGLLRDGDVSEHVRDQVLIRTAQFEDIRTALGRPVSMPADVLDRAVSAALDAAPKHALLRDRRRFFVASGAFAALAAALVAVAVIGSLGRGDDTKTAADTTAAAAAESLASASADAAFSSGTTTAGGMELKSAAGAAAPIDLGDAQTVQELGSRLTQRATAAGSAAVAPNVAAPPSTLPCSPPGEVIATATVNGRPVVIVLMAPDQTQLEVLATDSCESVGTLARPETPVP